MFKKVLTQFKHAAGLGLAAAVLFGTSQSPAQTAATPNSGTQPAESSVMLPPPTPPTAHAPAQTNVLGQSQEFMRPAGDIMPPPQPPTTDRTSDVRPTGRAQLGVYVVPADGAGVRISSVTSGTAAAAAGLKPGDILLAMNGRAVTDPQQVIQGVRDMNVGDAVELRIWQNGTEQTLTATLMEMQSAPIAVEAGYAPATEYLGGQRIVRPYSYYYGGPVVRQNYYPRTYGYGYYPYGSYGYGNGSFYGAPGFGYYRGPWGSQAVQVGPFGFGWR